MNSLLPRLPQNLSFRRRIRAPKQAPASRLARPMLVADGGLRFTECLLLGVLLLAYLLSLSMPLFGIPFHRTFLNHAALVLLGPVLALHLAGLLLNRQMQPAQPVLGVCWPLILLAGWALVGSAVAKWEFDRIDSYISFGTYLMLLPFYAAAVPQRAERLQAWAVALLFIWVLSSTAALIGESVRFNIAATLHEIEYLVAAGFFAMYYAVRNKGLKVLALVMMVAASVINQKLTGYIILAMALLHILTAAGWRRLLPSWRGLYGSGAVVFTVVVSTALALLYFEFREFLPSGNPEVRLAQYDAALRQFYQSPIWGSGFIDGSGEVYRGAFQALYIPTHSDVLDILKHGGLIGLALFAFGYWKIFLLVHRAVKATLDQPLLNAYFVSVRFFQVTALVTFSLNPLLLKGPFLIVIWCNLGLAVGMALTALRAAEAARQP